MLNGGKMRILSFILCMATLTSACDKSSNANTQNNPPPPNVKNKIEPGNTLSFMCSDSFNKTTVSLISAWDANSLTWLVFIEEFDGAGNQVMKLDNLVGAPDDIESLHMNITNGVGAYAKIIQVGESEALYKDGNRVLNCSFQ